MKYSFVYIIICLSIKISIVQGQSFQLYGDKTFGGSKLEESADILYVGNGEFIISGNSYTNLDGDKTDGLCQDTLSPDIWVIKFDSNFNIIWQNSIGGNKFDVNPTVIKSNLGNNFIFGCVSTSTSSCDKSQNAFAPTFDYWIYSSDLFNNKLFDITFGGTGGDNDPAVIQLSNGEYIVCGSSTSGIGGDKTVANFGMADFWTLKFDSNGTKIWDQVYGGTSNELSTDNFFDLIPDDNGNFLILGYTGSPVSGNISQPSQGGIDIWLVKIDSSGNKLWDQRFGGSGSDLPRKIIPTADNGYILCGRTFSPQSGDVSEAPHGQRDMWVIKLDSVGNKLWDKRYGGTGLNDANWIEQDFDGGYLIGGTTTSQIGLDVSESPFGVGDYWIIKTDSIGNKVWDKRFGGPGNNILTCFALLPDSSIMLFGYADSGTTSVKTQPGNGLTDYWLVHFKYNNSPSGINELSYGNQSISIYPNPVTDELLLNSQSNLPLQYFRLYDLTGRLVYEQLEFNEKAVNISQLKPAIYFYQILDSRNNFYNGKLLKQ